jgi:hypothetical protein
MDVRMQRLGRHVVILAIATVQEVGQTCPVEPWRSGVQQFKREGIKN